jgi:fructose-1,6-bisphosphatase
MKDFNITTALARGWKMAEISLRPKADFDAILAKLGEDQYHLMSYDVIGEKVTGEIFVSPDSVNVLLSEENDAAFTTDNVKTRSQI